MSSSSAPNNDDNEKLPPDESGLMMRLGKKIFASYPRILAFMDDNRLKQLQDCEDLDYALEDCRRVRDALLEARRLAAEGDEAAAKVAVEDAKEAERQRLRMEETVEGLKIFRYFGWGVAGAENVAGGFRPEGAKDSGEAAAGGGSWRQRVRPDPPAEWHDAMGEIQAVHTAPPAVGGDGNATMTFGVETAGATTPSPLPSAAPGVPSCSREESAVWTCRGLALGCGMYLVQMRDCLRDEKEAEAASLVAAKKATKTGGTAAATAVDGNRGVSSCVEFQRKLVECVNRRADELEGRVRDRQKDQLENDGDAR